MKLLEMVEATIDDPDPSYPSHADQIIKSNNTGTFRSGTLNNLFFK